MHHYVRRVGAILKKGGEVAWQYMSSLAAVCLFLAVLGLGMYHAVVKEPRPVYYCYAGVVNPAGAEPPRGITLLGRECFPDFPHARLEYDPQGRISRMCYVREDGNISPFPGSRVAQQVLSYSDDGHLIRKENRNAAGGLVDDAQGVAVRAFVYDSGGRMVRTEFLNSRGKLVTPRFPGFAVCLVRYDDAGRPLEIRYQDADGKLVPNAQGEELVLYEYGDNGVVTRKNMVDGVLRNNCHGVASEKLERLPEGNGSRRMWHDETGAPALHPSIGAAMLQHEPCVAAGLQRRRFLGADGQPCHQARACAEHLVRSNSAGKTEWECFGAADGMPVNHPVLGYAERVCEYAADGALIREWFWDAEGLPAQVSERRHIDTGAGLYTLSLQSDGATVVQPE